MLSTRPSKSKDQTPRLAHAGQMSHAGLAGHAVHGSSGLRAARWAPTLLATLLGACSGQTQQGACVTSVVMAGLGNVPAQSRGIGGFYNFGDKRCSATFEFMGDKPEDAFQVWTARHCGPENFGDDVKVTIDVYADGILYQGLEVEDDFQERRRRAMERAATLPEGARKIVQKAFAVELGLQGNARDAGCTDESRADAARGSDLHSVCANWWDLGISKVKFKGQVPAALTQAIQKDISQRAARERQAIYELSQAAPTDKRASFDAALWKTDLKTTLRFERLRAGATLVDALRAQNCATAAEPKPATCAHFDSLVAIGREFVSEDGDDIIWLAEIAGHAVNTPRAAGQATFDETLKKQQFDVTYTLQKNWENHGRWLMAANNALYISTNVLPTPEQTTMKPAWLNVPIMQVLRTNQSADAIKIDYTINGLEYFIARDKVNIVFTPGDSGSLISVKGLFPVLALSGVDGKQSSGGASVLPLPNRRSGGDGSNISSSASKDKVQAEPCPSKG